jgi:two-component system sensor histidine kinase BaeS
VNLRTRLIAAFTLVAVIVLTLSGLATFVLVRRSLQKHALDEMRARASDLEATVRAPNFAARPPQRLRIGVRVLDMHAVFIAPDGTVTAGLPSPLQPSDIDPQALLAGQEVSGRRGNTVYLALPTGKNLRRQSVAVVAVDTVDFTVLHRAFPLMVLAGLIVLAAVVLFSIWLARRLTKPIREIERAAGRLAAGDLSARADVPPSSDEEFADLARTLNTMAAQLEQSRGSERAFLLSISHDLRTPLTSIRGYAEALADGTLDDANPDDRKKAATVISGEARRLERLVGDLLDLSRLDSRQFSLQPSMCDATEVVRAAAEAFLPQARDLGVQLDIRSGDAVAVDLDAERLAQIVANLVENALKYAATHVQVYAAPQDAGHFSVVVGDDGPGIPVDQRALVFERLYTVRDTPGRAVGTGLGLAIVRELAAAMGGGATVDDQSRFVVTLPR